MALLKMFSSLKIAGESTVPFKWNIVGPLPQGISATDLDGDGDQDLVYARIDYPTGKILTPISIWENRNGNFHQIINDLTNQNFLSFPGKVITADFDLNGLQDIYIGTFGDETIAPTLLTAKDLVLFNKGNFNFDTDPLANFPASWAHGSTVGDINNDGKKDIFSSGMVGWPSYYFIKSDNGWNIVSTNLTSKQLGQRANIEDSLVGDLDSDGFNDLTIAAWAQNHPSSISELMFYPEEIIWGGADGTVGKSTKLPFPKGLDKWNLTSFASAAGDINKDGLIDLVISYTNDGSILKDGNFYPEWEADKLNIFREKTASYRETQILLNNGDRTFVDVTDKFLKSNNNGLGDPFLRIHLEDLNKDGYLDLIGLPTAVESGKGPYVWLNDVGKQYTPLKFEQNILETWYAPFLIDIDRDGDFDLANIGGTDSSLPDGTGSLGTKISYLENITKSNKSPTSTVISKPSIAVEGKNFSFKLVKGTFSDPDKGDSLIYSSDNLPYWLKIDSKTGKLSGTVNFTAADESSYTINLIATDKSGASASAKLSLIVNNTSLLNGTKKNDFLIAGVGNDFINGSLGNDTLTGGFDNDTFVFNSKLGPSNIDTITDFVSGSDKIALDDAIFKRFRKDKNLSDNFNIGPSASASSDYIIYDSANGKLYYDADGNGNAAAIQIALLGIGSHPTISASDFVII